MLIRHVFFSKPAGCFDTSGPTCPICQNWPISCSEKFPSKLKIEQMSIYINIRLLDMTCVVRFGFDQLRSHGFSSSHLPLSLQGDEKMRDPGNEIGFPHIFFLSLRSRLARNYVIYVRDGTKYALKALGKLFQYRGQNGAVCFHCVITESSLESLLNDVVSCC